MLSAVMLSVVMLNVVMLSVVAPLKQRNKSVSDEEKKCAIKPTRGRPPGPLAVVLFGRNGRLRNRQISRRKRSRTWIEELHWQSKLSYMSVFLSVYIHVSPSICPFNCPPVFICLPTCMYVCRFVCVYMYVHPTVRPSICLFTRVSLFLSFYVFVCLSKFLSVFLSFCLSF